MEFFRFYPDFSDNKLYYKHYDADGNYLSSGVVPFSDDIVIENDYHFVPGGLYKDKSSNNASNLVAIPFEFFYDVRTLKANENIDGFIVKVSEDFISIYHNNDFVLKKPTLFYFKKGVLRANISFSYNDNPYNLQLEVDVLNFHSRFYFARGDQFSQVTFDLSGFANSNLFVGNFILKEISNLGDSINSIENVLQNFNCDVDLSSIESGLNSISQKVDSIDLSSLNSILGNISQKVDVLNVLDISNMIDEKLSQLFNLKSLNGSNGSKFKDGSIVKVKGYDGDWKVDGSYHMLNNDGVTIVVYKLVQGDRVLLAPSPFVGG